MKEDAIKDKMERKEKIIELYKNQKEIEMQMALKEKIEQERLEREQLKEK